MVIGIMGAMPEEVDQLCARLSEVTVEEYGGVCYHRGSLAGRQAVVCCAGMGKANAAATTQVLITKYGAEKIIFSGVAGNMTSKIGIGDVVIGQTVLYHDADMDMLNQNPPYLDEYPGDPALIAAAQAACAQAGVKAIAGRIATGDRFVGDTETKRKIEAACHPDCVEMEGAAVSQIAAKNGVPLRHPAGHERQRRRGRLRGAGGPGFQHQGVCCHRHPDRGRHDRTPVKTSAPPSCKRGRRFLRYRNCCSFWRLSSSKACSRCISRRVPGAAPG